MKSVDAWLDEYGESHRNPTNKAIHWICVPLILWTVTALFWSIPTLVDSINWAVVLSLAAMLWYIALSPRLSIGIGLLLLLCLAINAWLEANVAIGLWQIALTVFVLAWIGQFIGHHIEGKKPSFFRDLQFLLVGPAWLMGFVYRKFGWGY